MKIDLSNKRAVVTGSTSGIGFAIAQGLAEAGADIIINGRTQKNVDSARKRLVERVARAKVERVAADLSRRTALPRFIERVPKTDILVNNLGIFEPKPYDAITDDDWQRFFDTNVMSGVRLSRHYLPSMVQAAAGRVVFISSEFALNIPVEMIHYGMTKTAQPAVSRGLAELVAGTGVTVNAVLPGPTRSDGVVEFFAKLAKEQGMSETGDGKAVHCKEPPDLTGQTLGDSGRSDQHGRLRLLAAGIGHHRRRADASMAASYARLPEARDVDLHWPTVNARRCGCGTAASIQGFNARSGKRGQCRQSLFQLTPFRCFSMHRPDVCPKEAAMNFVSRLTLLALPLLTFLGSPAQAQEVEVGTGLVCDTQEQVERFIALYDGDAQSTVNSVNAAEHNPTACGVTTMAYVRGRQLATARSKDTAFQIVPILVLGVVTEAGVESVTPSQFFSVFEIEEIGV